jgi:hypothetical protein
VIAAVRRTAAHEFVIGVRDRVAAVGEAVAGGVCGRAEVVGLEADIAAEVVVPSASLRTGSGAGPLEAGRVDAVHGVAAGVPVARPQRVARHEPARGVVVIPRAQILEAVRVVIFAREVVYVILVPLLPPMVLTRSD